MFQLFFAFKIGRVIIRKNCNKKLLQSVSLGKKLVDDVTETNVNEKIKGLSSKCFPAIVSQKILIEKKA